MTQWLDYMCTCRKALHQIPELGFEEQKTSGYLRSQLEALDIPYESVAKTGLTVFFKGRRPKRTIAFRADIDGLPMTELSDYPLPSQHEGKMHACGHDGHMSMLLGLAHYLKENESKIQDNILLIFQPAEEGPGGAIEVIKAGVFEKYGVDCIYGIHVLPSVAQGQIGICKGPAMAMVGEVDIDILTDSAHGAMPHMGQDAVYIGSECVMGLQSIVSRNVNPIRPAVLTVGVFNSGDRRNILSGKTRLEATVRAFDKETFHLILERMNQYLKGIEQAYGIEIHVEQRILYPPVINDATLYDHFYDLNREKCVVLEPQMISEDFAYYQEKVPGFFYFVGTRNEERGFTYPLHNNRFNFDDKAMQVGLDSYIDLLEAYGSVLK